MPSVKYVFPELAEKLKQLLCNKEETALADQVHELQIHACCSCDDGFCTSFYTAPPPEGGYGPGHRNICLEPDQGMLILDVVDDAICFVEVLDHKDMIPAFEKLRAQFQQPS